MRWSIVRLICVRELRDQLRDRRTIFMIAVLPMLLYPVLGMAVVQFAVGTSENPSIVGIVGKDDLPQWTPRSLGFQPGSVAAWFAMSPAQPGLDGVLNAAAVGRVWRSKADPPPLLIDNAIPGCAISTTARTEPCSTWNSFPRTIPGSSRRSRSI